MQTPAKVFAVISMLMPVSRKATMKINGHKTVLMASMSMRKTAQSHVMVIFLVLNLNCQNKSLTIVTSGIVTFTLLLIIRIRIKATQSGSRQQNACAESWPSWFLRAEE